MPPVIVVFGDEPYQKALALRAALDELLPPEVDRAMALGEYDGAAAGGEEAGGPAYATVMDDLATLPFLTDRRVVVIREADRFVSAHRERLERYVEKPFSTGCLILDCRSFPKTTRLYKAVAAAGRVVECKKLSGRALVDFAMGEARARGKRLDSGTAAQIVDLIGQEQAIVAMEIEKLALFVGPRAEITSDDVGLLVGQTREERIFAVMDAAGAGRTAETLKLWHQTLATDSAAVYRAIGGMAFVVRKWLTAHRMIAAGAGVAEVAPKVMMWGRERELETILRRVPARRAAGTLAALAGVDAAAKSGLRSLENGIEGVLVGVSSIE
ncbi:DNA polymerase III subunit delta [Phycisphaerae bacterium RAS1]|nr:DNA polymerase III subunit delta [Phycisphaerae bacterium RAS1]